MRCPKCGYISFDHLDECLKCNKDIKKTSNDLYGSAYNIPVPAFLKLQKEQTEEHAEQMDLVAEQSFSDEDDYVDEDLEILVAEEEPVDVVLSGEDEEDGDIEIDFSQFENAEDSEIDLFDEEEIQQEQPGQLPRKMDVPEELSDISDLAPPAQEIEEKEIEENEQPAGNSADLDFAGLDLDDLDFDLGLDGVDDAQASRAEIPEEAVLALDEIDFAESLAEGNSDGSKSLETMGMDDDLDFDLDLGGLSIHKDV